MIAPLWIVGAAGLTSAVYAGVGLGGATAYLAILSVTSVPFEQIPPLVFTLNLLVAGRAFWGRRQLRLVPGALLRPLILGSIPAAFLGGLFPLRQRQFLLVLALVLLVAGVRFLFGASLERRHGASAGHARERPTAALVLVGMGLGLVAGMTGIGGGVYLGPVLLLTGWADLRTTPGVTSGFVFLNSAAGLSAHLTRVDPMPGLWIPLILSVVLGAAVGVTLSLRGSASIWTQRALGLVLVAAALFNGVRAL